MVRMSNRKISGWFSPIALALVVSACGGSPQPEPEPEPEPEPQVQEESAEDIAAREAEEARLREEEERARLEAERSRVMSVLVERVHFDFDKSDIRSDAEPILQRKVSALREHSEIKIRIAGNCDERGSNEYNLALGQRRAEAVRRYLLSYGLDQDRFITISYGEERPLDRTSSEEAWAMNRSADFDVTDAGSLASD